MSLWFNIAQLVIGQTPGSGAGAPPPPLPAGDALSQSMEIHSLLDWVIKGGWFMAPIGLCSVVAVTLIVERMISLRRGRVIPRGFVAGLKKVALDQKKALEYCRSNGSPIANVLAAAIKRRGATTLEREKLVEEEAQRELVEFRKHMRVISVLPQVSTMLGLLGTIFGMIKTFQSIAASGESLGKTEMLAEGIFEAWTATAGGLLVAIPVLIAFHYLMGKIDATVAALDREAVQWLEFEEEMAGGQRYGAVATSPSNGIAMSGTGGASTAIPAPV